MFDSGVSAEELIQGIIDEADIELPVPLETWVLWLNQLEHLLYSEIIKEQKKTDLEPNETGVYKMSDIPQSEEEAPILAEDICFVFADRMQLMKSTVASGVVFPDTWYIDGNDLCIRPHIEPEHIAVIYYVKPKHKAVDGESITGGNVRVPYVFLDMVRARLRGEAYKLANEDTLAAKWLNDYNVLLENFKVFIQGRMAQFGQ